MLDYQRLSEEYKPTEIKLLLVGEAPPDGGNRFFYNTPEEKYDFLFRAVYKAIDEEGEDTYERQGFPANMKEGILYKLQYKGIYMIDLCPIPLSHLPADVSSSSYGEDFIQRLKDIPLTQDCHIVIFKAGTIIQPLLERNGYKSEILSLSRDTGGRGLFITRFRELYHNLKKRR